LDLSHQLVDIFLHWGQSDDTFENVSIYRFSSSDDETRIKTKSLLLALQNSGKMLQVTDLYRETLCNTIRVTLRTIGREYAADVVKHHKMKSQGKRISWHKFLDDLDLTMDSFNAPTSEFLSIITAGQFLEFIGMIFEQVTTFIESGVSVTKYLREEGISLSVCSSIIQASSNTNDTLDDTPLTPSHVTVLQSAVDVAVNSIAEILRVRKESNIPINYDDVKRIWDSCLKFTQNIEKISSSKCYGLRSALLGLVKSFIEQKHESNLASLASALEGENWNQCDVRTLI
jgi:hypothetical protein